MMPAKLNSHRLKARGFTLIEVVLALMILGMAMVILTASFTNAMTALDSLRVESDRQGVLRFIRTQLLQIADREEFEKGGDIETLDLGKAKWSAKVEDTQVADLFHVFLEIELSPPDAKDSEKYNSELYILRPTWSDPVDRSKIMDERKRQIDDERLRNGGTWL
ncbi:MAG: type II secretion system protein [Verrucomicrobiota bacterium]|nr:type II secretion system protein [Verrucomicrobiota bacterium]